MKRRTSENELLSLLSRRQDDEDFGNVVFLSGDIDHDSSRRIMLKLLRCEQEDEKEEIFFFINSPGGYIDDVFAIYDTMKAIRNPIYTICFGHAMSGAALLLAAGHRGERRIGSSSRAMIHEISICEFSGTHTDLEVESKEAKKLNDRFIALLAKEMEKDIKEIRGMVQGGEDHYFTAQQAKKAGLVDIVLGGRKLDGESS